MQLEDLLTAAVEATGVVGASVGVLADENVEVAYAGLADLDTATPVDAGTRFQIASVTKPMVATVIAKLSGEGRLALDDPVAMHVPELRPCEWGERVTLLDLLANRGGVPLLAARELGFGADGDDCLARFAAAVAKDPLMFEPGAGWSYSNTAWCLLGRAIEVNCGSSWEEAMQTELLDPLDLHETGFISRGPVTGAASCYNRTAEGTFVAEPWRDRALGPAGATVWSSVGDLLRFARLHLDDGRLRDGTQLVRAGALAALRTVEEERSLPDFMDAWGRGWAQYGWPGGPVWGWCGIAEGHRAVLQLLPHRNAALALLADSSDGRELYRRLFPHLLAWFGVAMPELDRTPRPIAASNISRYAGTFGWPDEQLSVRQVGNRLHLTSPGLAGAASSVTSRVFTLSPGDADIGVVVFDDFDRLGTPQTLYVAVWAYPRLSPRAGTG